MDDELNDYEAIVEALRELVSEYKFITHFVINPEDAKRTNKPILTEDDSGEQYFEIDGYRLYLHEECPMGKLGACVPDQSLGLA